MALITRALLGGLLASISVLAAGCSAGSVQPRERAVFYVATGFGQGLSSSTTVDIVDVGVPALYNVTGQSVRVRKVTLVAAPPAVRLLSVTAHPGLAMGVGRGNLVTRCRTAYPSYPVTDAVTRPRAASNWHLVLAIRFTRPGRYNLGRVKVNYTTGGQDGWQYQNIFTRIVVHAARPGTKPWFDGCP